MRAVTRLSALLALLAVAVLPAAAEDEAAFAAARRAVHNGDLAALTMMLTEQPDLVAIADTGDGKTLLHFASETGRLKAAGLLLDKGAVLDAEEGQ